MPPLAYALENNFEQGVRALIEKGADPNMKTNFGIVAELAVKYRSSESIISILLTKNKNKKNEITSHTLAKMLLRACQSDADDTLAAILKNFSVSKNAVFSNNQTLLHIAAKAGAKNVVSFLINCSANLNVTDLEGNTPVMLAAAFREEKIVKQLIMHKADMSFVNENGKSVWDYIYQYLESCNGQYQTPLSLQSKYCDYSGCLASSNEQRKRNLLHIVAENGNTLLLSYLAISCKMNLALADENGENIFHHAAKKGQENIFRLWANEPDELCDIELLTADKKQLHELLQCIGHKNIRAVNNECKTPVQLAIEASNFDIVQIISTQINPKINSLRNINGQNLLHNAASNKNKNSSEIMKYIINQSTDQTDKLQTLMNQQDIDGNTPLHIAVQNSNLKLIPFFSRANPNITNKSNLSPFHYALLSSCEHLFEAMMKEFSEEDKFSLETFFDSELANLPVLHHVIGSGNIDRIRLCIQRGANVLMRDHHGNTALHHLATVPNKKTCTHSDIASVIISAVAISKHHWQVHLRDIRHQIAAGKNKLSKDVYFDVEKLTFYLMRCIGNDEGQSVINYACSVGNVELVKWLLKPIDNVDVFNSKQSILYDVTFLTPDYTPKISSRRTKFLMRKTSIFSDINSPHDNKSPISAFVCDDNQPQTSVLESVLQSEQPQLVAQILDVMPMQLLLQKYIFFYKLIYTSVLLLHLIFMIIYSSWTINVLNSVPIVNNIKNISNTDFTENLAAVNQSNPMKTIMALVFLLWPMLLFSNDIFSFFNSTWILRRRLSSEIRHYGFFRQILSTRLKVALFCVHIVSSCAYFAFSLIWYFSAIYCSVAVEILTRFASLIIGLFTTALTIKLFWRKSRLQLVILSTCVTVNFVTYIGLTFLCKNCDRCHPNDEIRNSTGNEKQHNLLTYHIFFLIMPTVCFLPIALLIMILLKCLICRLYFSLQHGKSTPQLLSTGLFFASVLCWSVTFISALKIQIVCLSFSYVVGWWYTLHFTKGFESLHAFDIILKRIIMEDVLRFILFYLCIIIGFSLGLQALDSAISSTQAALPLPLSDRVYQTFKLSVGLNDVNDLSADATDQHLYAFWGVKLINIGFIIIVNIILINLLISMMGYTYNKIIDVKMIHWRYDCLDAVMNMPTPVRKSLEMVRKAFGFSSSSYYNLHSTDGVNGCRRYILSLPMDKRDDNLCAVSEKDKKIGEMEQMIERLAVDVKLMMKKIDSIEVGIKPTHSKLNCLLKKNCSIEALNKGQDNESMYTDRMNYTLLDWIAYTKTA